MFRSFANPASLGPARLAHGYQALAIACGQAGIDAEPARPIRLLRNAVFELPAARIVVKVAINPELPQRADNALAAARLLAANGIPAVRPAVIDCRQPVQVDGCTVTFWQQVDRRGRSPDPVESARLLRQLHRLPAAGLPAWDPMPVLRGRVLAAAEAGNTELDFLLDHCAEAQDRLAGLRGVLPPGIVHGDARPGHLIPGPAGPVWCDLDATGVGPPEWDLVPVAVAASRFPGGRAEHTELARAYGFDVTTWAGFPVLRLVHELMLITATLSTRGSRHHLRAQVRHRLADVVSG